jgi:predicted ribosomally synthesized peptide with nif11-like leader
MDKSAFENLSEETRAKLVAAKTPEEILAIAKSEGIKLSEEDLEAVSGGSTWSDSGEPCKYS